MRTLLAKDIAPFTKILAKMELKESIKGMFNNKDQEKGAMIAELIWGVIENYYKCEKEFFIFLANLENKTEDEIANLPLNDLIELITELFSERNFSFFKLAAK